MATQGVHLGQIHLYNTMYHSQEDDLVSGKVVEFGGEPAGRLYDRAVMIANSLTGDFRNPGFEPPTFGAMWNRVYAEAQLRDRGAVRPDRQRRGDEVRRGQHPFHLVRLVARAIDAAGPNPTRAYLARAMGSLGGIDLSSGVAASYRPGKTTAPDELSGLTFHYPCPGDAQNDSGACIIAEGDYLPLPER